MPPCLVHAPHVLLAAAELPDAQHQWRNQPPWQLPHRPLVRPCGLPTGTTRSSPSTTRSRRGASPARPCSRSSTPCSSQAIFLTGYGHSLTSTATVSSLAPSSVWRCTLRRWHTTVWLYRCSYRPSSSLRPTASSRLMCGCSMSRMHRGMTVSLQLATPSAAVLFPATRCFRCLSGRICRVECSTSSGLSPMWTLTAFSHAPSSVRRCTWRCSLTTACHCRTRCQLS